MSFLNPLLLLGAIGVAAPLWLHLREKPATNVVPFSALRFLLDQPPPRRQPLRLRDPLLLALRALALTLVVAGFAWPLWHQRPRVVVTESRVHILDNTLSQQVEGAFERDRDRVLRALASSGTEIQDAVIELTAQPSLVVAFAEPREAVEAKLGALAPSFERGSYLEAFRLADGVLAKSLGRRKRIIVYGDGQANQWTENENAAPFLHGTDVSLASAPSVPERPNLSLAEPAAQRTFFGEKAFVELAVRIGHQGEARRAKVVLSANGRDLLRETLDLGKDEGAVTLRARWESDPSAWVEGVVSLEGEPDALPADNRSHFALPPVTEGRVALLAQSPYLKAALSPEIMKGRWATRAVEPWRLEAPEEGEIADVLVLEGGYLQSQRVRDLVFRHLNDGRGVLLLVDRGTPLIRGFLRELGFEIIERGGHPRDGLGAAFRYVAAEHPIFKPFLSPDFGDLSAVRVRGSVSLRASGALPLLFSEDGEGLLFEGIKTKGRLLVFAFGLDRSQTTWPLDPTFVPFLDLCLQHSRSAGPVETSLQPGEVRVLELPSDLRIGQVVLRSGAKVVARAPVEEGGRVRIHVPRQPGLYVLCYDEDPAPRRILAVNPPAQESVLAYVAAPAAVKSWQVASGSEPPPRAQAEGAETPWPNPDAQRLWWWLFAAGLGLLTAETAWLLAQWRTREAP